MITKNEFINGVENYLRNLLDPRLQEGEIITREVKRSDGIYNGLTIRMEGQPVAPIFNLDDLYEDYKNEGLTSAMYDMAERVSRVMLDAIEHRNDHIEAMSLSMLESFEQARHHLQLSVCSKAGRELLDEIPHVMKEDIPLIVKVILDRDSEQTATVTVNETMLDSWGVDQETVFAEASKNMKRILPYTFASMYSMLMEATGINDFTGEEDSLEDEMPLYVLTNEYRMYGMGELFADGVMDEIGAKLGDSFYVLPSSVHEVLIIPEQGDVTMDKANELIAMVTSVNEMELPLKDQVTDNAYHYDTKEKKFEAIKNFVLRKSVPQMDGEEKRVNLGTFDNPMLSAPAMAF